MNIKKCMALFLALMMALALVACGANQDTPATTVETLNNTGSAEHLDLFEESITTFMDHLVTEVPRESWDEVMAEMPWSYRSINTFNTNDPGLHGDDTWAYYNGQFCVMADSWHFMEWSSNIKWDIAPDSYDRNRTFSLEDDTKDGYMLFLFGDYYFYLVEISSTRETQVTCLEDHTLNGFYALWSMMSGHINRFLEDWSEDPIIDEKTLHTLYNYEHMYSLLSEYIDLIDNQEDREKALTNIELGYCSDPIQTLLYDQEYRDFGFGHQGSMWDMSYSYYYHNGTYILDAGYHVWVKWTHNIHSSSLTNDIQTVRTYEVIDPTQDSYLLLWGEETGYALLRIVAQGDNSVHTPDTHPRYTIDEFKRLYYNIADICDENLAELAETCALTEDCLQYLRINAEDHEELYWYGERLTGTEYEEYIRLKEGGWIAPPLTEIDLTGNSAGHLYTYADGVFTLESPYIEIVCTNNIADIRWDPYEHDWQDFYIADTSKPAYIEVMGEGGYQLYYFYPG